MKITDAIQEIRRLLEFKEDTAYAGGLSYVAAKSISGLLDVIHSATLIEDKGKDLRDIHIMSQNKDIEKFRKLLYALSVVAKGSFNSKLSNDELVKEVESFTNSIIVAAGLVEKDVGAGDRIEKLRSALFEVIAKLGGDTWNGSVWTDDELIENVHGGRATGIISFTLERQHAEWLRRRACINGLLDYLQPGIHRGPDDPDYIAELENAMELLSPEDKHPWVEIILAAGKEGGVQRKRPRPEPPTQGDGE